MVNESSNSASIKTFLYVSSFISILYLFLFSPVVFTPFIFHDDSLLYDRLYQYPIDKMFESIGLMSHIKEGRPFLSIAWSISSRMLIESSNHDTFFILCRVFNLTLFAGAISLFAIWLCANLDGIVIPTLIAILLFFLPGLIRYIGDANSVASIYSVPIVMLALWCMGLKQPIIRQWSDFFKKKNIFRMGLAILCLNFVLFTYQLHALNFLTACLIYFIFSKKDHFDVRKVVVFSHLVVFGLASIVYMALYKGVMLPIIATSHPEIYTVHSRTLVSAHGLGDIFKNFQAIFEGGAFGRASSLWVVSPNPIYGKVFTIFFVFSFLSFLITKIYTGFKNKFINFPIKNYLEGLFLIFSIFIGINCVNIVYGPTPLYRNTTAQACIFLIFFLWAITFWINIFFRNNAKLVTQVTLGVLTVITSWMAQYNLQHYYGLQSNREMLYLESQIQPFLNREVSEVHITRPKHNSFVDGDEYSRWTTGHHVYTIKAMIFYLYKKYGREDTDGMDAMSIKNDTVVRLFNRNVKTLAPPLQVDMNLLLKHFSSSSQPNIKASSMLGSFSPSRLVSDGNFVAWHAQVPPVYPEWIKFNLGKKTLVKKLSIRSQLAGNENPIGQDRGPREFILQSSKDDINWNDVMTVKNACTQNAGEWRDFKLPKPASSKFFRILIQSNCGHHNLLTVWGVKFNHFSTLQTSPPPNLSELPPVPPRIELNKNPTSPANWPSKWGKTVLTASSTMATYGPEHLISKGDFTPWHAKDSPQYPEWIKINFIQKIELKKFAIRSQKVGKFGSGNERGPKEMILQIGHDGTNWTDALHIKDGCTKEGGKWREFPLPKPIETRFMRIMILSNCGHPKLLTVANMNFN